MENSGTPYLKKAPSGTLYVGWRDDDRFTKWVETHIAEAEGAVGADQVRLARAKKDERDGLCSDGSSEYHITLCGEWDLPRGDEPCSGVRAREGIISRLEQFVEDARKLPHATALGMGLLRDGTGDEANFALMIIVDWPALQELRVKYGFKPNYPHVTVGFKVFDIHGPKDRTALIRSEQGLLNGQSVRKKAPGVDKEPWSKKHKRVFRASSGGTPFSLSNSFAQPLTHKELVQLALERGDSELVEEYNDHSLAYTPNGGRYVVMAYKVMAYKLWPRMHAQRRQVCSYGLYSYGPLAYTPNDGSLDLRNEIATRFYGAEICADNVLVTTGGQVALQTAAMALAERRFVKKISRSMPTAGTDGPCADLKIPQGASSSEDISDGHPRIRRSRRRFAGRHAPRKKNRPALRRRIVTRSCLGRGTSQRSVVRYMRVVT